ncbi:MAG: Gfo/Idh/MocA family oxidoreductase [Candidatus Bathyarchaeia archaeon]
MKVAIVGCGWAGRQHASAWRQVQDAEITAVCDVELKRAEALALELSTVSHPALAYSRYEDVFSIRELDAVSICLPHYLHAAATVAAVKAGKHVLCEKPIATSLPEADMMIGAAEAAGVMLMIAENVRFDPTYLRVQELIAGGRVGEPFLFRLFRDHEMHSYLRERPWFLSAAKAGGGIWLSGGIHDVEALRMLGGEVESVITLEARKALPEMESEDTVAAILVFRNGALGVLTESFSTMTAPSHRLPLIVNGPRGTIQARNESGTIEVYGGVGSEPSRMRVEPKNTFVEEVRHFVECVKTGREPITSGRAQREALRVVLAGFQSMQENGSRIRL